MAIKNKILSDLPKRCKDADWINLIGKEILLLYKDKRYEVKIVGYKKGVLWIDYDGYIYEKGITTKDFRSMKFSKVLKTHTSDFKYEISQSFQDEKRDFVITDREYREKIRKDMDKENQKWYKYTCNKCGWKEGWMIEGSIKRGVGCSCCYGRTAVLGINTIWDTDRWMCDLGVSEEDAKKYTKGSNKKIKVKCPNCGKEKKIAINNIRGTKSIGCTNCGDGVSYPEKFVINMLNQLGVKLQLQLTKTTFDWCGDYRYDFYISEYNTIIEAHGEQHYVENRRKGARTLAEEQENDRIKKELAFKNGIKEYIELDCRYSDLDYIKNSILSSKLAEIFDLSKITWSECEEYAIKSNRTQEICEYWNHRKEWETTQTIADNNKWGICARGTIRDYLKKGEKIGWCKYNPKEEKLKAWKKKNKGGKQVEIFKNGQSLGLFQSTKDLERRSEELFGMKLSHTAISNVCKGKLKHHKGFTFKYI